MKSSVNMPTIIMALVVTLPISALMIAVLRNGGTLIKPSVPVASNTTE
ncbi:MAG: hypothetical protein LBK70_01285 [Clostridiales bacterium]|nr:hypothetical protein [Clostridiales bacterium]